LSPYVKKVLVAGAVFLSLAFLVILAGQVTQLAEFADRFHPLAGDAVFWGLVFVLALSLLVPAVLVLRLPRPLVPPTVNAGPEFDAHVAKLSARLLQNARVRHRPLSTVQDVETALTSLDALAVETTMSRDTQIYAVGGHPLLRTCPSGCFSLTSLARGVRSGLLQQPVELAQPVAAAVDV